MSNRARSEGFYFGDVIVATKEAQGLVPGTRYVVLKRTADPAKMGTIRYTLRRLHAAGPIEVTNLPLLAEREEEGI